MVNRQLALVAAALFVPAAVHALDPHRANSQYVVTKWGARELASNTVHALLQTRDRYLWLGTGAGLVRFDGARFTLFDSRNTPEFGDGGVSCLSEGADGTLYFGTTSGAVMAYKDGTFTRLAVEPGTGVVSAVLSARDDSVWIAMHGRPVYQWHGGRAVSMLSRVQTIGPLALEEDGGGLWIGTRGEGLVHYDGREFVRSNVLRDTVQALKVDRTGALWIGTPHGLYRLAAGRLERFGRREGLSHDDVTAIEQDRDGNVWIGTAGGGLNRYTSGRFSRFTSLEGLSDDDVRSLFEDHEGNLWVGTADGLNCLSEGRFITYGRFEGLPDPSVASILGGSDGSVWMGTTWGGVARLRDGKVQLYRLPGGLGEETVLALHEGRDGLWIGMDNGRLFRLANGAVVDETPVGVPRSWKVPVIYEDEQGPVFYITGVGLSRVRNRQVTPVHPGAPRQGYLHHAHRDAGGTLWLCSSVGLGRIRNGEHKLLTTADGLPNNRVRWLSEDVDGGLWLATIGGLAYMKDGRIRSVTLRNGLPENYLRLVLDDGHGYLWIASKGHVFRLEKRNVHDFFSGRVAAVSPVNFDLSDGLRTTEAPLSNNPGFRAADGRFWFATAKGISVVDPTHIHADDPAPAVTIESLSVDGVSVRREEYDPGRGEVTIEYTALSFRSPANVRFRHRLEGLDQDWVAAGPRRSAYYSTLPPGDYRFTVMASNRDGVWNGTPTSVSFTIRPPFFRTGLFYAICALLAVGLAAAAHQLRVRQVRARLAAVIGERTRIARELHDTLAQGLAGVGIQLDTVLQSLVQAPQEARRHVHLARAMVRSSLSEVRRSIWVLRAQTLRGADGLGATLTASLGQLTADSGIAVTIDVAGRPRALPVEVERNLLRIAHEAVTNAVRHSGAKHIDIGLSFDGDAVQLRVHDDGCGFDPSMSARSGGDHFGLLGISERTEALGGELHLESRPGLGTEIVCRLPYHTRLDLGTDGGQGLAM